MPLHDIRLTVWHIAEHIRLDRWCVVKPIVFRVDKILAAEELVVLSDLVKSDSLGQDADYLVGRDVRV